MANFIGVLAAVSLCAWYHKRMLERRRRAQGYHLTLGAIEAERDIELGGLEVPETDSHIDKTNTVAQELDDWDENAEDDWDETEDAFPESGISDRQDSSTTKPDFSAKDNKQRME